MTCHTTLPPRTCNCHEHRPECDCVPVVASPPLQPLSPAQVRFLALHVRYLVTEHQWYFVCSQLRATTDTGRRAYLWRDELDDLVARGLMQWGIGCADVKVTPAVLDFC